MGVSAPAAPERPPSKRKGVLIGGMFAALILLFGSVIVITNANARAEKEKQERAQAELTRRTEEVARAKKAAEVATEKAAAQQRGQIEEIFEPVYLAMKQIGGATTAGVTYNRFLELLGGVETQVSIASDRVRAIGLRPPSAEIATIYETALQNYRDSAFMWKKKIDQDNWYGEKDGSIDPDLRRIVATYNVKVVFDWIGDDLRNRTARLTGKPDWHERPMVDTDIAPRIWAVASGNVARANALFFDETREPLPPKKDF